MFVKRRKNQDSYKGVLSPGKIMPGRLTRWRLLGLDCGGREWRWPGRDPWRSKIIPVFSSLLASLTCATHTHVQPHMHPQTSEIVVDGSTRVFPSCGCTDEYIVTSMFIVHKIASLQFIQVSCGYGCLSVTFMHSYVNGRARKEKSNRLASKKRRHLCFNTFMNTCICCYKLINIHMQIQCIFLHALVEPFGCLCAHVSALRGRHSQRGQTDTCPRYIPSTCWQA